MLRARVVHLGTAVLIALALVGTVLVGLGRAQPVLARPPAATFTVSNTDDNGTGSLRQAILDANANPGEDVIEITAVGTIRLLTPLPRISETVIIQGPGTEQLAIDGGRSFRVFDITDAAVTIADLTIQHGYEISGTGGGIRSQGALTLTNVAVLSNTSRLGGGGVYVVDPAVIRSGRFENNRSLMHVGGGLQTNNGAVISATTFISNSAPGQGGGASVRNGTIIEGSHFENNHSLHSNGGGLYVASPVMLRNTVFISNTAAGDGGGMLAFGDAEMYHMQFTNNHSGDQGGGLYVGAILTITHSSFVGNHGGRGGGLFHGSLGNGWLENSLFARNRAAAAGAALFLNANGTIRLNHLTIAGEGAGSGSAVYIANSQVRFSNTIISHHDIGIENGTGTADEDYTLFFGNGIDRQGVVTSGGNSLNGNPQFINPAADNYRLGPGSAGIDTGVNAHIFTDFEGDFRPLGDGFDIGYDEARPFWTLLPFVVR